VSNSSLEDWEIDPDWKAAAGGQGTVVQVRQRSSGRLGALKTLHSDHLHSRERRYRMQQEVQLLNLLDGVGVPRVHSSNVEEWRSVGTPMYTVMEWVDGPTLADFCNGIPQSIGTAMSVVRGLAETVARCHSVEVLHRDIKPDNIILRAKMTAQPVLIDFGMGWATSNDSENTEEFLTDANQELGNRFLRLPEYAPGHHIRDSRSDVTMLVGIFFYLLTGVAPRLLLDGSGRMPHESQLQKFPQETIADSRWERIRRFFNVGFQQRVDMRCADIEELKAALASLSDTVSSEMTTTLDEQLARIQQLTESADGVLLEKCQRESLQGLRGFYDAFMKRIRQFGFVAGGQNPVITEWGRAARTTLILSKNGASEPKVGFVCQISFENGPYEASYSVIGEAIWTRLYTGPLADTDSMREAMLRSVDPVLEAILQRYATALEQHVARMKR
jgi:serine/threonine protein kinase